MFCLKCGNELPEGSMFCSKCGTALGNVSGGHVAYGKSKVILTRQKKYVAMAVKIKVFIDGEFVAELKNGDEKQVFVNSGKRALYCEAFGYGKSQSVDFECRANEISFSISIPAFLPSIVITKIKETPVGSFVDK